MTKIKIIFFLLGFLFPLLINAQQYNYVVDNQANQKKKIHIHISFKHIFKSKGERVAKRTVRKDNRKNKKANKQYVKSVKKHQKAIGNSDDLTPNNKKKVFKRMKKNRKSAKRQVNKKPRDSFFKRTWNKTFHKKKLKSKSKS